MSQFSSLGKKSPANKYVEKLTAAEVNTHMNSLIGERRNDWVTSWDAAHYAAEKLDILKYPRFYARTRTGDWVIREKYTERSISRGKNGPETICRAILVLCLGKGQEYSKHLDLEGDADERFQDSVRYGRLDSGLRKGGAGAAQGKVQGIRISLNAWD